jgi:hypothetical protein
MWARLLWAAVLLVASAARASGGPHTFAVPAVLPRLQRQPNQSVRTLFIPS